MNISSRYIDGSTAELAGDGSLADWGQITQYSLAGILSTTGEAELLLEPPRATPEYTGSRPASMVHTGSRPASMVLTSLRNWA